MEFNTQRLIRMLKAAVLFARELCETVRGELRRAEELPPELAVGQLARWTAPCEEVLLQLTRYFHVLDDFVRWGRLKYFEMPPGSYGWLSPEELEQTSLQLRLMAEELRIACNTVVRAADVLKGVYPENPAFFEQIVSLCRQTEEIWKCCGDVIQEFQIRADDLRCCGQGCLDAEFGYTPSRAWKPGSHCADRRYTHSMENWDLASRLMEIWRLGKPSPRFPEPDPRLDQVQFRCAAPMVLKPGKYFTAKIMMFREDDTDRADREARLIDDKVRAASSDVIDAEKGQEFTVGLQSPDLPELDAVKTIRWNGKYAARDFEILLPADYAKDQLRLLGRIYSDHTPLTDISLILEVCGPAVQEVACEKVKLRTAFVSYASKDRAEVVKRIQGMEAARDDMDIFIDVESLRRGEEYEPRLYREIRERDLFYLFWSRNAAASEWVGKELAYAVAHKDMTRIEPIALEAPEICPPPESLNHRHFRDWTLKYTT